MITTSNRTLALAAMLLANLLFATRSQADPLSGEVAKFDQQPMIGTPVAGALYFGHDEFSTAYGVGNTANPPLAYQGRFMADDFADKVSTPVVHLSWWGSYINDNNAAAPQPHVQKFLVAFESDVPAGPNGFSQPGQVLDYDIVTVGALAPGSGTFTESQVRGPDTVLGESLFKYNAELHLGHEFPEKADTVYWLKITALVDVPQPVPSPIPAGVTQWGWHNRDYTIGDPLASTSPAVNPGEHLDGTILGQNIFHFQDDAVQGDIRFTPSAPPGQDIIQLGMLPTNYLFVNSAGVGPIDGPQGIDQHSKDLAFTLYTKTQVPEPASCLLMTIGLAMVASFRRRQTI
jgi:hypothetical protein